MARSLITSVRFRGLVRLFDMSATNIFIKALLDAVALRAILLSAMDKTSYGIVTRYDADAGTIDVRLDGDNDDCYLLGVPVATLSPDVAFAPTAGMRCVVGYTPNSGDAVCFGFMGTIGEESDAARSEQDTVQGDLRLGRPDANMLSMQRGGLTALQAAPGTGLWMHGDSRAINVCGEKVMLSTPTVNGGLETDDAGWPKISLFVYNALGKILEALLGATRIWTMNAPGLCGISETLGGDPTNPAPFRDLSVVGAAGTTQIHIGQDGVSITSNAPVSVTSTSNVEVSAPSVTLKGVCEVQGALNVVGALSVGGVPLSVP